MLIIVGGFSGSQLVYPAVLWVMTQFSHKSNFCETLTHANEHGILYLLPSGNTSFRFPNPSSFLSHGLTVIP